MSMPFGTKMPPGNFREKVCLWCDKTYKPKTGKAKYCAECRKKAYYSKQVVSAKKWFKEWAMNNPEEARKMWREKHLKYKGQRKDYAREYARTHTKDPLKVRARSILNYRVNKGEIIRPDACEACLESKRVHAHHHMGYEHPLVVQWLCSRCHALEHHPLPALDEVSKAIKGEKSKGVL